MQLVWQHAMIMITPAARTTFTGRTDLQRQITLQNKFRYTVLKLTTVTCQSSPPLCCTCGRSALTVTLIQ